MFWTTRDMPSGASLQGKRLRKIDGVLILFDSNPKRYVFRGRQLLKGFCSRPPDNFCPAVKYIREFSQLGARIF